MGATVDRCNQDLRSAGGFSRMQVDTRDEAPVLGQPTTEAVRAQIMEALQRRSHRGGPARGHAAAAPGYSADRAGLVGVSAPEVHPSEGSGCVDELPAGLRQHREQLLGVLRRVLDGDLSIPWQILDGMLGQLGQSLQSVLLPGARTASRCVRRPVHAHLQESIRGLLHHVPLSQILHVELSVAPRRRCRRRHRPGFVAVRSCGGGGAASIGFGASPSRPKHQQSCRQTFRRPPPCLDAIAHVATAALHLHGQISVRGPDRGGLGLQGQSRQNLVRVLEYVHGSARRRGAEVAGISREEEREDPARAGASPEGEHHLQRGHREQADDGPLRRRRGQQLPGRIQAQRLHGRPVREHRADRLERVRVHHRDHADVVTAACPCS
mmetsp:Transcript_867/g.2496  ORF Transcript_867/g.2496 Transcript_867/m.2496 type:complete len:381 (-) Transcript_867:237-1379(-)